MATIGEILRALGKPGPIEGPGVAASVGAFSVDSRTVVTGGGFAALSGERTDGHSYVRRAVESGARLALVSRPVEGVPALAATAPGIVPEPPLQIIVDDVLTALQRLAQWIREQHPELCVIGVTGSVGKTTTKDAIAAVLAQRYPTLKNTGNRNNEIGLPLTLTELNAAHRVAVLEMGMYDLREIAQLCEIARPQIGVVTNVGPTHLERLGTIERIAQAKAELVQALPAGGVAVLNGDDHRVAAMAEQTSAASVTIGLAPGRHTFTAGDIEGRGIEGIAFTVTAQGRDDLGLLPTTRRLRCAMIGEHAVWTALAALAVGQLRGLTWEEIEAGLASLGAGPRLVPKEGRDGMLILDDSYNSSPTSCHAALDALAPLHGRKVVVLGDMLELGAAEQSGHLEVGRHCAAVADVLLTVGERARGIAEGALSAGMAPERIVQAADRAEALDALEGLLAPNDLILIKASRGMALEALVDHLEREKDNA